MDYPDGIDEYEMMYGDELDLLDEREAGPSKKSKVIGLYLHLLQLLLFLLAEKITSKFYTFISGSRTAPSSSTQDRSITTPIVTPGPSRHGQQDSEDLFLNSPALSQIPHNSSINRRKLFGAASTPIGHRGVSTPLHRPDFESPNIQDALFHDSLDRPGRANDMQQRKRRLGVLFEDVFIPDETDHIQKKLKNEEEKDENLIRMIIDARLRNKNRIESKKGNNLLRIQELNEFKRRNLAMSVPRWPFTVVTRSDGDRIYIRTHSEDYEKKELEEIKLIKSSQESILGDQKEAIWDSAREFMANRVNNARNRSSDVQEVIHLLVAY